VSGEEFGNLLTYAQHSGKSKMQAQSTARNTALKKAIKATRLSVRMGGQHEGMNVYAAGATLFPTWAAAQTDDSQPTGPRLMSAAEVWVWKLKRKLSSPTASVSEMADFMLQDGIGVSGHPTTTVTEDIDAATTALATGAGLSTGWPSNL
jgi:hypothetical protein